MNGIQLTVSKDELDIICHSLLRSISVSEQRYAETKDYGHMTDKYATEEIYYRFTKIKHNYEGGE